MLRIGACGVYIAPTLAAYWCASWYAAVITAAAAQLRSESKSVVAEWHSTKQPSRLQVLQVGCNMCNSESGDMWGTCMKEEGCNTKETPYLHTGLHTDLVKLFTGTGWFRSSPLDDAPC